MMRRLFWVPVIWLGWLGLAGWSAPLVITDTQQVVDGSARALDCIRNGVFLSCSGVYNFPLYQYLPATFFHAVGLNRHSIFSALFFLNYLAILGVIALFWRHFARRMERFWLAMIALATGPFLFYAGCTLGEPLAAFFLLLLVSACLRGAFFEILLFSVASAITKETSYPFVLLLAWGASLRSPKMLRKQIALAVLGVSMGFLLSSGFNLFRYGGIWNEFYIRPALHTPSLKLYLNHLLALALSPNGGLLVFWPSACWILLLTTLGCAAKAEKRGMRLGLLALSGVFVGVAGWHTPFGWAAWGPRFLLPWLPALLLLGLEYSGDGALRLPRAIARSFKYSAAALGVLICLGLPHALSFGNASAIVTLNGNPSLRCPGTLSVERDPAQFYRCIQTVIWPTKEFVWLDLFQELGDPALALSALGYGLTLCALGALFRKSSLNQGCSYQVSRATTSCPDLFG